MTVNLEKRSPIKSGLRTGMKLALFLGLSGFLYSADWSKSRAADIASILPPAKTQFLDSNGKPLASGTVDFYIPGTTTRKTTWQDAAETIPNTNPVVLDAAGRALILGFGSYRQVIKDKNNNPVWDQVTSSAGSSGGGGSSVGDGLAVGSIMPWSGFTVPTNYQFTYGQELSRTTYSSLLSVLTLAQSITCVSGNATLNAIADTSQLNIGAKVEASCVQPNSVIVSKTINTVTLNTVALVSTTLTATFFPYGNGNGTTTFNVPDYRGVVLPGRCNMGGSSCSVLSNPTYTDPNALYGAGGQQNFIAIASQIPSITSSGTNSISAISNNNLPKNAVDFSALPTGGSAHGLIGPSSGSSPIDVGPVTSVNPSQSITVSSNSAGGLAVSATIGTSGSGYTDGTQLLTLVGGTCTVQPQFNVSASGGIVSSPVLVTAGQCNVSPVNPASTTGGGGTGATLNVTYSPNSISLIQPSKTANYIIKVSPDINLSIAVCADISNAGTACVANTGTSGHTLGFLDQANTYSANQTFSLVAISGGTITGMPNPTLASDVANKAYVDSVATGLNILAPSDYATAAILPNTPTYSNGASGVGATLTASINSTLTVDSNVIALNKIVLVKNQASAFQNGIYKLTTAGSGAVAWVLTRATYFDQAAEMKTGSYTFVTAGASLINTSYVMSPAVTTVGTSPSNWSLFSNTNGSAGPYVMVSQYGITCDNLTDWAVQLQSMIDGSIGKTIFIPPGPDCLTSAILNLPSNTTIIGGGREVSTIRSTTAAASPIFQTTNTSNINISNLWCKGTDTIVSWASSSYGCFRLTQDNLSVANGTDISLTNMKFSNFNTTFWNSVIATASPNIVSGFTFRNNLVVTASGDIPTDGVPTNNTNYAMFMQSGSGGLGRIENSVITDNIIDANSLCFGILVYGNLYKTIVDRNIILQTGQTTTAHCHSGNAYAITIYDLFGDGNPPTNFSVSENTLIQCYATCIYAVGDGGATHNTSVYNSSHSQISNNLCDAQTVDDGLLARGCIGVGNLTDISITGNSAYNGAAGFAVVGQRTGVVSVISNTCTTTGTGASCFRASAGSNGSSNTGKLFVRSNYFETLDTTAASTISLTSTTGARFFDVDISDNVIRGGYQGIAGASQFIQGSFTINVNKFAGAYNSYMANLSSLTGKLTMIGDVFDSSEGVSGNGLLANNITGLNLSGLKFQNRASGSVTMYSATSSCGTIIGTQFNSVVQTAQVTAASLGTSNPSGCTLNYLDQVQNLTPSELGSAASKYVIDHWSHISTTSSTTHLDQRQLTGN